MALIAVMSPLRYLKRHILPLPLPLPSPAPLSPLQRSSAGLEALQTVKSPRLPNLIDTCSLPTIRAT